MKKLFWALYFPLAAVAFYVALDAAWAADLKIRVELEKKSGITLPSSALIMPDKTMIWNVLSGIGPGSQSNLLDIFNYMETKKSKRLQIYLNSPQGAFFDAMGLASLIQEKTRAGFEVEVRAYGLIGSAAAIVLLSGTKSKRFVDAKSLFLIHDLNSAGFFSLKKILSRMIPPGKALLILLRIRKDSDGEKQSAIIQTLQDKTNQCLCEMTGLSAENLQWLVKNETWFDAPRAVELGFADGVIGEARERGSGGSFG